MIKKRVEVMRHLDPSKLFGAVDRRVEFNDDEREHLKNCEECSRVFAAFQSYFSEGTGGRGKSGTSGRGSRTEYARLRRFNQGDRVYVIGPIAENYFRLIGTVRVVT